ncbi:hypothetical protein L195_g061423, partial [Trifolium pratense]
GSGIDLTDSNNVTTLAQEVPDVANGSIGINQQTTLRTVPCLPRSVAVGQSQARSIPKVYDI